MDGPQSGATALITGAAGFIGSHLVRELRGQYPDLKLVGLDDLSGGFAENLPEHFDLVVGSVTDSSLVAQLFAEHRFAYVYHFAAYAAEGLSHFIRRFNYVNNVVGSINLINEAVRHDSRCFVFASSIAVYGAAQVPMREEITPTPEDPYGVAKYAVELDLKAARNMFGLEYVIFRPHNVYGEYQNIGDRYRNVVGIFMNQILRGEPLTVFGDGEQRRAFSYVGDIAGPIASAPFIPDAKNGIFNVGAETVYSVNQLAREVSEVMESPRHPVRHLPARNEVAVAYSDHSAAARVFEKNTTTDLRTGLEKMAAWVVAVGARETPPFDHIELDRGLPESWRAVMVQEGTKGA